CLPQHAVEYTPLARPLQPSTVLALRRLLVAHPSYPLLARPVSHRLPRRICSRHTLQPGCVWAITHPSRTTLHQGGASCLSGVTAPEVPDHAALVVRRASP